MNELEKNFNAFVKDTGSAFFNAGTEIAKLKEDIKNINKILKVITEGRCLELKTFINLEEALKPLFKLFGTGSLNKKDSLGGK